MQFAALLLAFGLWYLHLALFWKVLTCLEYCKDLTFSIIIVFKGCNFIQKGRKRQKLKRIMKEYLGVFSTLKKVV